MVAPTKIRAVRQSRTAVRAGRGALQLASAARGAPIEIPFSGHAVRRVAAAFARIAASLTHSFASAWRPASSAVAREAVAARTEPRAALLTVSSARRLTAPCGTANQAGTAIARSRDRDARGRADRAAVPTHAEGRATAALGSAGARRTRPGARWGGFATTAVALAITAAVPVANAALSKLAACRRCLAEDAIARQARAAPRAAIAALGGTGDRFHAAATDAA